MKGKRWICALLLAAAILPLSARADVLVPGQKPPRNESSEAFVKLYPEGLCGWDQRYDGAFDGVEEAVLWSYPNSGEKLGQVDTEWFRDNVTPADAFGPCYQDDQGNFWGYVSYIYGRRMVWICISDPANADLPADPEVTAAVHKEVRAMALRENAPTVILVAAVVGVTAVLIAVFWRRRPGSRPSAETQEP